MRRQSGGLRMPEDDPGWGIEDADGEVTFVDDEAYYKIWEENLDPDVQKPALDTLVTDGCDKAVLVALLVRLAAYDGPGFPAIAKTVSREDVHSAIDEIHTASNRLFELLFSEIGDLFQNDVDWFQVCRDLKRAASKLEEYDPGFKRGSRPDLTQRQATIVAYVKKRTGQPHDSELSILLGVALDKEYDLESLKMWRNRHKGRTG